MVMKKALAFSVLATLLIWTYFTWPLALHIHDGIPMAHSGGQEHPVRPMEAGDHLQLLYYFWLFSDMVRGETPWMYNPYEFNTGDESARYQPEAYYAPFSWIYTLISFAGSRALAYNLSAIFSLWITLWFTWLLVRRYVSDPVISAAMSLIAIMLPYRWFCLLGGSPTGFGMAMTPLLLWGLDRAVRDASIAGGVAAALAIIFSFTSDLHIFFFNVLLTPAWCVVSLTQAKDFRWASPASYTRVLLALLPVLAGTLAVVLYSRGVADDLSGTHMSGGRTIQETMIFSPQRNGLFAWHDHPVSGQIYIGYLMALLILAGGVSLLIRFMRKPSEMWRDAMLFAALLAGISMIALLAMGPHGPRSGYLFVKAREWIPEYDMIRQAGKIYGILPPMLALVAALAFAQLNCISRRYIISMAILFSLGMGWEYGQRQHPPVSLLDVEQPAYAAVANDAAERGERPHAIIVTLWPGDSHYASAYQYYASLYRIRMVNGYTPAINQDYFNDIFLRFQSINQGWMTGDQADELIDRGVNYLILHEDLFPEKVSPFPIAYTIQALLKHPRLELLRQSGPVWSFRILGKNEIASVIETPAWSWHFAARHYIFERVLSEGGEVRQDSTASRGQYLALTKIDGHAMVGPTDGPPADQTHWMFRARGTGSLNITTHADDVPLYEATVSMATNDWTWISAPAQTTNYALLDLRVELREGAIDLCSALLTAGPPLDLEPGESIEIPAALFFHAGNLDLATGHVHFLANRDRPGHLLYGPKLPLPNGRYETTLAHNSPAKTGAQLGSFFAEQLFMSSSHPSVPVIAGSPAILQLHLTNNLPLNLIFDYQRRSDFTVESISIRRME